MVYDAILNAGGVGSVEINKPMLQYIKNAHGRYKESLDKKKRERSEEDKEKHRKREADKKINELEVKKAKLLADAQRQVSILEEQMKDLIR